MVLLATLPLAFEIDRVLADVQWLVETVGPRPSGSAAAMETAEGISARMTAAGWPVMALGHPENRMGCRGTGQTVILAHSDTVSDSPGAVDNAAGVAVLLELARTSQAPDLCLGFPGAEERGLVGSGKMAASWIDAGLPQPGRVIALDLVGHGRLSVTGLGRLWQTPQLRWLAAHADVDSHYLYQAVSRTLPWMERSDHRPFAMRGIPALHLLGRGPHGVFPRYHQPDDTEVSVDALTDLASALESLALAPPLPTAKSGHDPGILRWGMVIPGWITWLGIGAGLVVAAREWRAWPHLLGSLLRTIVSTAGAMVAMGLVIWGLSLDPTVEEKTAAAVMGLPANGWWASAPLCVIFSALVWLGLRRGLGGVGSGALAAGLLTLVALCVDPLFAFPVALASIMARIHPLLGLAPTLYFLQPNILRELSFHGLIPPTLWGVVWLLAWPAFGCHGWRRPEAE